MVDFENIAKQFNFNIRLFEPFEGEKNLWKLVYGKRLNSKLTSHVWTLDYIKGIVFTSKLLNYCPNIGNATVAGKDSPNTGIIIDMLTRLRVLEEEQIGEKF